MPSLVPPEQQSESSKCPLLASRENCKPFLLSEEPSRKRMCLQQSPFRISKETTMMTRQMDIASSSKHFCFQKASLNEFHYTSFKPGWQTRPILIPLKLNTGSQKQFVRKHVELCLISCLQGGCGQGLLFSCLCSRHYFIHPELWLALPVLLAKSWTARTRDCLSLEPQNTPPTRALACSNLLVNFTNFLGWTSGIEERQEESNSNTCLLKSVS